MIMSVSLTYTVLRGTAQVYRKGKQCHYHRTAVAVGGRMKLHVFVGLTQKVSRKRCFDSPRNAVFPAVTLAILFIHQVEVEFHRVSIIGCLQWTFVMLTSDIEFSIASCRGKIPYFR